MDNAAIEDTIVAKEAPAQVSVKAKRAQKSEVKKVKRVSEADYENLIKGVMGEDDDEPISKKM